MRGVLLLGKDKLLGPYIQKGARVILYNYKDLLIKGDY